MVAAGLPWCLEVQVGVESGAAVGVVLGRVEDRQGAATRPGAILWSAHVDSETKSNALLREN